jgi:predicted LPLAT superfamily acyltransferase
MEPVMAAFWAGFFLLVGAGRKGVMRNLSAIKPGASVLTNFIRAYRVFWNFAWAMNDTVRFKEHRTIPDWEFGGREYFEQLVAEPAGAIILTAHMGSYDLGAQLFSEVSGRDVFMVRAPEADPATQKFEAEQTERTGPDALKVEFNTKASDLALELLDAVQSGEIIAVQGDRVTEGLTSVAATLFGQRIEIPAGPFALAMAARVRIYPMFIIRVGRRRYRLETFMPFTVERSGRQRDAALEVAVNAWTTQLESVVAKRWYQWFTFTPFSEDLAA